MLDLFHQPPLPTYIHGRENSAASEAIYVTQEARLNENARILKQCMMEGQRLTGLKIMRGVKHSGMTEPKIMTEYRKRFQEIIKSGANVSTAILEGGHKEWWLEAEEIERLRKLNK